MEKNILIVTIASVIVIVVSLCLVMIGYTTATSSIIKDCDQMEKFRLDNRTFACTPINTPNK